MGYDYTDAIIRAAKEVRDAWLVEGSHPNYHLHMQWKLTREWPVLAEAVAFLSAIPFTEKTDGSTP